MAWRVLAAVVTISGLAAPAQARDLATPAAAAGRLRAVSCTSDANCWAVGNLTSPLVLGTGLIEHWNGSTWQVAPSQNPPGSSSSLLDGVACAQVTNCWAVGYYDNATSTATLPYAEHWNGRTWSELAMPYPAGETLVVNLMRAVSCPTARRCFAVGSFERDTGAGQQTASLIERWKGRSWQIVPSPTLTGSNITGLQGLSCASARDCWATGTWLNLLTEGGALADHWNGHRWTAVRVQVAPYKEAGDLTAVSCPALLMCMAVGAAPTESGLLMPYVERWNGSSWLAAPIGTGTSTGLTVDGVSCATSQLCMAVGSRQTTSNGATLAERWDGSSWATLPSPNVPGASGNGLNGIACTTVTSCWAVGSSQVNTTPGSPAIVTVLIEHWNGAAWTVAVS